MRMIIKMRMIIIQQSDLNPFLSYQDLKNKKIEFSKKYYFRDLYRPGNNFKEKYKFLKSRAEKIKRGSKIKKGKGINS